jgi:hypothetical protein
MDVPEGRAADPECAICGQVLCMPVTTACRHTFCRYCLSVSLLLCSPLRRNSSGQTKFYLVTGVGFGRRFGCSSMIRGRVLRAVGRLMPAPPRRSMSRQMKLRGYPSQRSGKRAETPRELHPIKCGLTSCLSCSVRTPTVCAWCEDWAEARTQWSRFHL